ILRLSQERFQPFDNPDTYEARIRPLILGVPNDDARVLGTLKTHLSGDRELYSWMRNENIEEINEFFIILKNMWLERSSLYMDQNFDQAQSKKKSFTKQNDNAQSSQPASNILQSTVSQPAFPSYDEMQKSFQAMFDKQDTKHKAEMEKLKAEFQMTQQPIAQKEQTLVPQIVKQARQPKGPPSNLITKEDYETYHLGKYSNNL